jgi:hypothetical protein
VDARPPSDGTTLKTQEADTSDVPLQALSSGEVPLKNQEANTGDVTAQEQPTSGVGDTKTFGTIIGHFLSKIPFLNKTKEAVTTKDTIPNATPDLPAPTATGE